MRHKVCLAVFSTNRPEYLSRTLEAQRNLDFADCAVDRILIDDMPRGRDDSEIRYLAKQHGYRELILHRENLSIGATWEELWARIRDRDYDYVLQQEDDVEVLQRVSVVDMISALEEIPGLSQVVLKRQPWYAHETASAALDSDTEFRDFRGEFTDAACFFTPISSLYPIARTRVDYRAWYRDNYPNEPALHTVNVNEAVIGKALLEGFGLRSMHLKDRCGGNIIRHIGEYTVGKKVLPGEPGYEGFACCDPCVKYWSGTNRPYENGEARC
jgi:hypothetical protein